MIIANQIASDVDSMQEYFKQLFIFSESSAKPYVSGTQLLSNGITHFVRQDMVCNIYSLVDFWLDRLCNYHQLCGNISVTFLKFKKNSGELKSDLHKYAKYFSKIASFNISEYQTSFDRINELREVRNIFIHKGGHAPPCKRQIIESIRDVSIEMTLIVVTNQFIFQSLDHASQYLQAVAKA